MESATAAELKRVFAYPDHTGETYDKTAWPAVYDRILGVSRSMEPLDLQLIERLGEIRAQRIWVLQALEHLLQFLEVNNGRYRLYHARLADFLTSDKTRDNSANTDLYQDTKKRHGQITDQYWRYEGNWTRCDDCGLRNLAAHLYEAEQFDRLADLISQEWMHARVSRERQRYYGFVGRPRRVREARAPAVHRRGTNDPERMKQSIERLPTSLDEVFRIAGDR